MYKESSEKTKGKIPYLTGRMIALEHVSLQYGGRVLLKDVSVLINPHDRVGLVGPNGAGKSTLLRILTGTVVPDTGTVNKAGYVTVGYLPQDGVTTSGRSLYSEVESAFEDVVTIQRELDEAREALARMDPGDPSSADTLEVMGELQHRLEDLDAYRMKSKIERVLMGLGFPITDFERQTEEFSGGWQMRIALAKLLLKEPSLLLLDEPTNHLDLDSLQWLEEYLRGYDGAIILVSHDRAFLDALTTRTLALRAGDLEEYAGNYSFYEREKDVRKELLVNAYKNQQDRIRHTQEFIDRFRYKASKARQVQSRIKQLEKMELVEPESGEEEIRFRFPPPSPSGRVVMEVRDLVKSYGPHRVFNGLDYRLERGDRVAIVGPNGAGKSTLSRILAGVEPFDEGDRITGHNVTIAYFAQHQADELDPTKDALTIVDEAATGEIRRHLRSILGSFLFHGDDVFKKVSVLSGGERSRLALAKMLLQPANLLILDEPTNHLDMRSKQVLQEALRNYEGTYAIVSHDRAFLDPLVNKVLEVTTGGIRTYLGTLSEYVRKKREEKSPAPPQGSRSRENGPAEQRKRDSAERRRRAAELRVMERRLAEVESKIETGERRKKELEEKLADPEFYKNSTETKDVLKEHRDLQGTLEELEEEWQVLISSIGSQKAGQK